MNRNVWEWVEDDWHDTYAGGPADGSAWVGKNRGANPLIRGGSWISDAQSCRSACRDYGVPVLRYGSVGFRLAWPVALDPMVCSQIRQFFEFPLFSSTASGQCFLHMPTIYREPLCPLNTTHRVYLIELNET